jgi:hypothetical protein
MAEKVDDKLMSAALAVKRGEQKLADLPEKQREAVKKTLRATPDNKLRMFAQSKQQPAGHRIGQHGPQARFRRARSA